MSTLAIETTEALWKHYHAGFLLEPFVPGFAIVQRCGQPFRERYAAMSNGDLMTDCNCYSLKQGADRLVLDLSDPVTAAGLIVPVRRLYGSTAHVVRFQTNVPDGEGGTQPALWWALSTGLTNEPLLIPSEDGRTRYKAAPTETEVLCCAIIDSAP